MRYNKDVKKIFKYTIPFIAFIFFFGIALAASEFYLAPKNSTTWSLLKEFNEEFDYKNTSSVNNYFIPTKTLNEVNQFVLNKPVDLKIRERYSGTGCSVCPFGSELLSPPSNEGTGGAGTVVPKGCILSGNLGVSTTLPELGGGNQDKNLADTNYFNFTTGGGLGGPAADAYFGAICNDRYGTDIEWIIYELPGAENCSFDPDHFFAASLYTGSENTLESGVVNVDTSSRFSGGHCGTSSPTKTSHTCSGGTFSPALPSGSYSTCFPKDNGF